MDADHLRQLTLERAELIDRLSKAHRLIGAAQLYTRWYGEDKGVAHATGIANEMKAYLDGGLFGDKQVREAANG